MRPPQARGAVLCAQGVGRGLPGQGGAGGVRCRPGCLTTPAHLPAECLLGLRPPLLTPPQTIHTFNRQAEAHPGIVRELFGLLKQAREDRDPQADCSLLPCPSPELPTWRDRWRHELSRRLPSGVRTKVLLTGATGFVGGEAMSAFEAEGTEILALGHAEIDLLGPQAGSKLARLLQPTDSQGRKRRKWAVKVRNQLQMP